jgi:hypothetical protein
MDHTRNTPRLASPEPDAPTIIRNGSRKRYIVIDHETADDPRLSARALGFLVYILGKPNNWEVRADELAKRFNCGRKYAYATLTELIALGYASRVAVREAGRIVRWDLMVYESPNGDGCPDPQKGNVVSPTLATSDTCPDPLFLHVALGHSTKELKDQPSTETTKTSVQPHLNGDAEAAPSTPWPASLEAVRRMLDDLDSPQGFYDLKFWQQIHAAYEPLPDVFYVDELRKYLVWWHAQPPSRRRKAVTRSFATWLRAEEAKAAARAERKVSTNGFHPQPLR